MFTEESHRRFLEPYRNLIVALGLICPAPITYRMNGDLMYTMEHTAVLYSTVCEGIVAISLITKVQPQFSTSARQFLHCRGAHAEELQIQRLIHALTHKNQRRKMIESQSE